VHFIARTIKVAAAFASLFSSASTFSLNCRIYDFELILTNNPLKYQAPNKITDQLTGKTINICELTDWISSVSGSQGWAVIGENQHLVLDYKAITRRLSECWLSSSASHPDVTNKRALLFINENGKPMIKHEEGYETGFFDQLRSRFINQIAWNQIIESLERPFESDTRILFTPSSDLNKSDFLTFFSFCPHSHVQRTVIIRFENSSYQDFL
jgi:hypothetical protein